MATVVIIVFAVPVIAFELTGYLFWRFIGDRLDRWADQSDDSKDDAR